MKPMNFRLGGPLNSTCLNFHVIDEAQGLTRLRELICRWCRRGTNGLYELISLIWFTTPQKLYLSLLRGHLLDSTEVGEQKYAGESHKAFQVAAIPRQMVSWQIHLGNNSSLSEWDMDKKDNFGSGQVISPTLQGLELEKCSLLWNSGTS